MPDIKNPKAAIPIVLIAGIFWSFGPYVVRHIDQPHLVTWQYLFTRGIVIFLLLIIYLFLEEGLAFYKNYLLMYMTDVIIIGAGPIGLACGIEAKKKWRF